MEIKEIKTSEFFAKIRTLPVLPEIIQKLSQMVVKENVSIRDITKLIESDPGLVSQVLRMINSAYFNLPQKILKVQFAVAFLGLHEIHRLCLTLSVVEELKLKERSFLKEYWQYSYLTASVARYLTMKYDPALSIEYIFPIAILHDIGQLVYLKYYPVYFQKINERAKRKGITFSDAVLELKLPKSSEIGSILCKHWGLPNRVVNGCRDFDPTNLKKISQQKGNNLIRYIIIASQLSTLVIKELSEEKRDKLAILIKDVLNINDDQFITTMGDIYEIKVDAENFLSEL